LKNNILILKLSITFNKIQNYILKLFQNILFKQNIDYLKQSKILIFRTGSLGDSVCAMPAIETITQNFKCSSVDILTNVGKGNSLVSLGKLINNSLYHKVIDYSNIDRLQLFKILRKNNYDIVFELPQDRQTYISCIRNMFIFRSSGIKTGFGWQFNKYLFEKDIYEKLNIISETDRLLSNLSNVGLKIYKKYTPEFVS